MSNQHQYGLLPCKLQGGVNHETTGKRPYLVRINRVLHVVDIHTPDPESPVRSPSSVFIIVTSTTVAESRKFH